MTVAPAEPTENMVGRIEAMPHDESKATPELYTALLEAQRAVKDVKKNGHNAHHDYHYATAEDVLEAARQALHSAGLLARRPRWWLADDKAEVGGLGEDTRLVVMECEVRHPESGGVITDEIVFPAVKQKGRPWDKALSACLTTGWEYWLRDQLQITRGIHPDEDVTGRADNGPVEPDDLRGDPELPTHSSRDAGDPRATQDYGQAESAVFGQLAERISKAHDMPILKAEDLLATWMKDKTLTMQDLADRQRVETIQACIDKIDWSKP